MSKMFSRQNNVFFFFAFIICKLYMSFINYIHVYELQLCGDNFTSISQQ